MRPTRAGSIVVTNDTLSVDLTDGRTITVPLASYPRLSQAPLKSARTGVSSAPVSIHWPDLDEDISVRSLPAGRRSDESQASLQKWLASRAN